MSNKTGLLFSDFTLYHYTDFWYYRPLVFDGKIFKISGKNKNKLRTIYSKNHESFKNSKLGYNFTGSYIKKTAF